MTERWKSIDGHPLYEVSSAGRVRRGDFVFKTPIGSAGYPLVMLGNRKHYSVHRLVALAFLEKAPDCTQVNHINGIRSDNRLENLEWCTASQNVKHGFAMGRRPTCDGKRGEQHPTSKPVIATCRKTRMERRYGNAMDAVREGFESSCISRCASGKQRHHKGFEWRYE